MECPPYFVNCQLGDEDINGYCTCDDYVGACYWIFYPHVPERCITEAPIVRRSLKEKKPKGNASKCAKEPFFEDKEGVCNCKKDEEKGGYMCGWYLKCNPEENENCSQVFLHNTPSPQPSALPGYKMS